MIVDDPRQWNSCSGSLVGCRRGNRAEEGVLRLSGVEPCVLDDDGTVRADHRGVVGVSGNGFGIVEVVEPDMSGPSPGDFDMIRTKAGHDLRSRP